MFKLRKHKQNKIRVASVEKGRQTVFENAIQKSDVSTQRHKHCCFTANARNTHSPFHDEQGRKENRTHQAYQMT